MGKMMTLEEYNSVVERNRRNFISNEGKKFSKNIGIAREVYKQFKKRDMPESLESILIGSLKRTEELINKKRSMEKTYYDDAQFANYAMDIVTALVPSFISEEIVNVQDMERRRVELYYADLVAETQRGEVDVGETLIGAKNGFLGKKYAGPVISNEIIGNGNGTTLAFTGTLSGQYLQRGSYISISWTYSTSSVNTVSVQVPLSGTTIDLASLTGFDSGKTNTINISSGAFDINIASGYVPKNGTYIYITYNANPDRNTDIIGKVKWVISSEMFEAYKYVLETEYIIDALYDYEQVRGQDAKTDMLLMMTSQIRGEIDNGVCFDLLEHADAGTTITWNKRLPTGVPWIWHLESLFEKCKNASSNIFKATRKAEGSFIVAGLDIADVIASSTRFKNEVTGGNPSGSHYIGDYGNWRVYVNPDFPATKLVMGYRGENYLYGGYVLGMYVPLYTTPVLNYPDTSAGVGMASLLGTKFVNSKMYQVIEMVDQAY